MKATFELNAESREMSGKGASRRLRRLNNLVPAIVYGAKDKPANIQLKQNEVRKALENEAFYSHILTLTIDGKKQQVVLKDLQRHVFKPIIMHMDFLRIDPKAHLHMHVPLHILGEAVNDALVNGGAVLSKQMVEVEVRCLPADLPEFIEIDISQLAMDGMVHLSEIKLPKGVEIAALARGINSHDSSVLSIHMPRRPSETDENEAGSAVSADAVPAAKVTAPVNKDSGTKPGPNKSPAKPAKDKKGK